MYIYNIYIYTRYIYLYNIYIYYTLHLELGLSENRLPANLVVYHHVCYSNGMAIWRYTLQTDSMLLPRHPPWCGPLRGRSWNPGWGGGRWKANRTERHFEKKNISSCFHGFCWSSKVSGFLWGCFHFHPFSMFSCLKCLHSKKYHPRISF